MIKHATYTLIAAAVLAFFLYFGMSPRLDMVPANGPDTSTDITTNTKRDPHAWSESEKDILSSLWLNSLPPLPEEPSNAVADNPLAAEFGYYLFFDARLSSNGAVSCGSCHKPEIKFTDGLPRAQGVGVTPRKTMTIIGMAYSPWLFWDGRKDSLWSQALGPTESSVEHGGNRTLYAHILANDDKYRAYYESLFDAFPNISDPRRFPPSAGPVDDETARSAWNAMNTADQETINRIFVNMGKAIAAYERLIIPGPSRFDSYVEAVLDDDMNAMRSIFTDDEANGLSLFISQAQCINCHNGPLFTNNSFHNTGIPPALDLPPDFGRIEGVMQVLNDPFNCEGSYSDASVEQCQHLRFVRTEGQEIIAAFKTPTLRNVTETAPYMHSGQFATLDEVLDHYNTAPLAVRGHSELASLNLDAENLLDLKAFLTTLSSPLATSEEYLVSPWPQAEPQ
jgi:cytochrome c peroxidase